MKEAGIAIQFLPSESIDRVVEVFCLWKLLCTNTIQCNSSAHSFFVKCPFPSFSNPCEVQLFFAVTLGVAGPMGYAHVKRRTALFVGQGSRMFNEPGKSSMDSSHFTNFGVHTQ